MQEMTVYGVSFDLVGKQPIVLLRTAGGKTYLQIGRASCRERV